MRKLPATLAAAILLSLAVPGFSQTPIVAGTVKSDAASTSGRTNSPDRKSQRLDSQPAGAPASDAAQANLAADAGASAEHYADIEIQQQLVSYTRQLAECMREFLWIEIGLAAILLAALIALYRQFLLMREHTTLVTELAAAARDTAEAATLNARAAINTNRPFVIIETESIEGIYYFRAVNYGKSPAQIVFMNQTIKPWNIPYGQDPPKKLSYGPGYDDDRIEVINVPWLAPGKGLVIGFSRLAAIEENAPRLWNDLVEGRQSLYYASAIKYRGMGDPTVYRSTFCYLVGQRRELIMAGPPGYNQCT